MQTVKFEVRPHHDACVHVRNVWSSQTTATAQGISRFHFVAGSSDRTDVFQARWPHVLQLSHNHLVCIQRTDGQPPREGRAPLPLLDLLNAGAKLPCFSVEPAVLTNVEG